MARIRGGRFSASNDGWAFPIGAAAAAGLTAPAWDVQYEADALPAAATPAWTKAAAATNSESVASSELHTSCSGAGGYLSYDRSGIVTAGYIAVVEAKMRVVSHSGDANWLAIWDGTNRLSLFLDTNALRMYDGAYHSYTADLTANRVVRLIKYGATGWAVYLDGALVLSGEAFAVTATNWISFGHPNAGSAGEVYWDYVYYDLSYLPV